MPDSRSALLIGASRGLGLGLAQVLAGRGWSVTATARDPGGAPALAAVPGVRVERADITDDAGMAALHGRAQGPFDLVFVVAGIADDATLPVHEVSAASAARVFETNAHAPLRVMERFADRLAPGGTMAVMTSILGSVGGNESGGWEIYRASKAALNTLTRSFALRLGGGRTVVVMAPGWVRTDMGGPNAGLDVGTSTAGMANAMTARAGTGECIYIDYQNQVVPW